MLKRFIKNSLVVIVIIAFLFPMFWIISSSLKPATDLFTYPLTLLPQNPTFENYVKAWEVTDFPLYFFNTTVVTVVATFLTVVTATACGYALAKYKYKWIDVVFICILGTTMLPTEVVMTAQMEVIRALGLYDTLWGVIIPVVVTPTGIFMMRQYFLTVPNELIESARLDGASEFKIFTWLMVPIAKPIIITLTVLSVKWRWNDYIWPLITLSDPDKYTVQMGLRALVGSETIDWSVLLASSVISMIPMIIVFIIFHKYMLGTDLTSGMKD